MDNSLFVSETTIAKNFFIIMPFGDSVVGFRFLLCVHLFVGYLKERQGNSFVR